MVYNITGQKANPNIPIPLPDMRDQPPGSHVPPITSSDTTAAASAQKPLEITPLAEAKSGPNDNSGGGEKAGGEKGQRPPSSQPAEKTEDKEWKELNKHSIGHILDSGDAPGGESATAADPGTVKNNKPAPAQPTVSTAPPMQTAGTGSGGNAPFQPLGGFQPPPQGYPGHPQPPSSSTGNYSNFPPNGSSHHGQQQQQANLYYPPPPQPYHPPYTTTGYETGGPTSYPTFQSNAPMGGGGSVGGHPYPPYTAPSLGPPKTNWAALSCPYSIAQCPLYCCHVRAMQELEEGATDWARPYGPPASGFGDPCLCCINT